MAIRDVGFGSMALADVREELLTLAPQRANSPPRLWIVASLHGSAWLNMVSLDLDLLLKEAKPLTREDNRSFILYRINRDLEPGQRVAWNVFTSFDIPSIRAFLQLNNNTFRVGEKQNLGAGTLWPGRVTLNQQHFPR